MILDVYSRKVVGFAISRNIDAELTCAALIMAIEDRNPKPGLIHHSDRGSQYAASAYCELMAANEICGSMSAKGNPYDNAFAERFMRTLKYEEVYKWNYETVSVQSPSLYEAKLLQLTGRTSFPLSASPAINIAHCAQKFKQILVGNRVVGERLFPP